MHKHRNRFNGTFALQMPLTIALISTFWVLLGSGVNAAPSGSLGPGSQKELEQPGADGGLLFAKFSLPPPRLAKPRQISLADRVAYQYTIEDVYWRHRIWPKANPGPKPPLDKVVSQAQIEKKVEDYLRDSQALEVYWQRPDRKSVV